MGKGDGSLTAINWYLTCSRLSCYLLEVGIYKERADIEVIKSCLLIEKNSIADCYRMKNTLEPQTQRSVKTDVFISSGNYVYQYGDATAVVQDGSEQNPTFYYFHFYSK